MGFLVRPETIATAVQKLSECYSEDLDEISLKKESGFLKSALNPFLGNIKLEEASPTDVLNILARYGLMQQFHNLVTALRIFLTLPVSVASN